MKITKNDIDALNASIVISLVKEDYEQEVEKTLKDYRKKANIPGFRPGKVPMGMVKKMYGTSVLVDQINKKVSHELYNYIYSEKLDILGEPLPNETEQKEVNWETDTDFEFHFDIALAPEFEVKLSKRDKLNFYEIEPSQEMIDQALEGYKKQFGEHNEGEEVVEDAMLKGTFKELKEEGLIKEDGVFLLNTLKTKKAQSVFLGKKKGETVEFELKKVFKNEADLKSMLAVSEEQLENLADTFSFTIESISLFKEAELNEDLFKKAFPDEDIKTEEEFTTKLVSQMKETLKQDAEYKFFIDVKEKLIKKSKFELPDAFLKRWLLATNKEITQEQIDKDYAYFQEDMKWQLIKAKVVKEQEIKNTEEDLLEAAKEYAKAQFRMYGSMQIPEEYLVQFAQEILGREEEKRKIVEKSLENKVIAYVKETIKVEDASISVEKFNKFFEKK